MSLYTIILLALIGLSAGILGGFAGVGGGIIMIPAMVFMLGLSQMEAQGTSLAIMIPPVGLLAAINYHKAGLINWKYAMVVAIFFVVGGYLGSKWAIKIPQEIVKKVFSIFLILVAIKLFFSK